MLKYTLLIVANIVQILNQFRNFVYCIADIDQFLALFATMLGLDIN